MDNLITLTWHQLRHRSYSLAPLQMPNSANHQTAAGHMTQLEQLHTLHMYPHSGTDFHGSALTVWCSPEFLFVRWDAHSDEAGLNAVMRDYMKLTCMSGIRTSELAAEVPRGDNSSCDWSLGAVCVFLNKFLMLVKFVKSPREERKRSSRFL